MGKLKPDELEQVAVERYVESLFTQNECRGAVLNAARYLEKNCPTGTFSESAVDMLSAIALAFAAGELDWVKDIGRDDE